MSVLEGRVREFLGPMISSAAPTLLDVARQTILTLWATKMAMVFEYVKPGGLGALPHHYDPSERRDLKEKMIPPGETLVWVARYRDSKVTCLYLTDSLGMPKLGRVSTFCVGEFVVQVLSYRRNELGGRQIDSLPAKRGSWDDSLMPIWPPAAFGITWPPSTALSYKDVYRLNARFGA